MRILTQILEPNIDRAMKRIILIILTFLLTACPSNPSIVMPSKSGDTALEKVYVVIHGRHTGIIIPSKLIQQYLPKLGERFNESPNIEFGWGDEGFYQADNETTWLTLKALFWPTESVVHVVAVPHDVKGYFSNSQVEAICLNSGEYSSLLSFISGSFYKTENGKILELKSGQYGDSQFYKGVGDYHLMNTCNNWTAKGLKSAGLDISPTFKLTARSIKKYIVAYNQPLKIKTSRQSTTPLHSVDTCR